ncbi:MAG: hypothetical protein M3N42_01265, partial [Cyanobacteriota bacterium]|nr:hypothetical protein [Cyanobacteriota bacterium]
MKNDRQFRLFKPWRWIAASILVGAGIWNAAAPKPAQAEPIGLQLSQNLQPPRRGPAVREVLSYEMKGDELRICKQEGNSEKKC